MEIPRRRAGPPPAAGQVISTREDGPLNSSTHRPLPPAGPIAAALLGCGLLAWTFQRIHTYVTAQDPFWYIALARQVLDRQVVLDELAPGLSFVAPGFPLLLAAVIRLFGPYAPAWLNLVLGCGLMAAYSGLLARWTKRPTDVIPIILITVVILLSGHRYNAHFLLYAFRGMPTYFLVFLAYFVLRPDDVTAGTGRIIAVGLIILAAMTIRETAVFALGGVALLLASQRRWRSAVLVLLPTVVGAAGYFLVRWAQGRRPHNQLRSWTAILLSKAPGELADLLRHNLTTMIELFLNAFGWWGVLLLGLGLWRQRRHPATWALCFVPAVLLAVFYSLYQAHPRYFLTVLLLLCPMIGFGALWIIERVSARLPSPDAPSILTAGLSAFCFAAAAHTIAGLAPWGRDVGKDEIRAFRRTIEALAPQGGIAFQEGTCRYLADATLSFTDLVLTNPSGVRNALERGRTCLYFEPLDEGCHYEGYLTGSLDARGVSTRSILRFYVDLEPVADGEMRFAGGQFRIYRVVPWSRTRFKQPLPLAHSQDTTVWLDFGERPVGQPARVRLHTRDGQPLYEWPSVPARHIMGFAIPGSRLLTGHSVLIVEADQPMPAELVLGSKMGRYPMSIDLGASRPLSTHYWFAPPFPAPSPWDHVAGVLTSTGRLILPVPVGDDYTELELLVAFEPATPLPGQQALLRCRTRDLDPIEQTVDLGAEWIYLQLTVPRRGSELEVALDLELESSVNPALRIRKVSFTPAGWMDSVGPSSMRPRRPAHRFSLAAEQPVRYR